MSPEPTDVRAEATRASSNAPNGRPTADGVEEEPALENRGTVSGDVPAEGENATVELARIGWLATVVACMIAAVILLLQGYFGYGAVTLAVAFSAAINLY